MQYFDNNNNDIIKFLYFQALSEVEVHTYASTIRANQELISALYDLLNREQKQEVSFLRHLQGN